MHNERRTALGADHLGVIASALCLMHCIVTPFLLSMSAVWAHYLPAEERFHRVLAVLVASIGCIAVIRGYRKHRRSKVLLLMLGLLFIFGGAYLGDRLPSHLAEIAVTMTGSGLLIAAHAINHTFCKSCASSGSGSA